VTHFGSHGSGRVSLFFSSCRISGLGVPGAWDARAAGAMRIRRAVRPAAADAAFTGRRGSRGQRPVRKTKVSTPRRTSRSKVSKRWRPGEARKRRIWWSWPTGPVHTRL
jgi:hypothetical protein